MKAVLSWSIRFYQIFISPYLGERCRFVPSCSKYSLEAIHQMGAFKGMYLSFKRIVRCHPWGKHGYDPVIYEK